MLHFIYVTIAKMNVKLVRILSSNYDPYELEHTTLIRHKPVVLSCRLDINYISDTL